MGTQEQPSAFLLAPRPASLSQPPLPVVKGGAWNPPQKRHLLWDRRPSGCWGRTRDGAARTDSNPVTKPVPTSRVAQGDADEPEQAGDHLLDAQVDGMAPPLPALAEWPSGPFLFGAPPPPAASSFSSADNTSLRARPCHADSTALLPRTQQVLPSPPLLRILKL